MLKQYNGGSHMDKLCKTICLFKTMRMRVFMSFEISRLSPYPTFLGGTKIVIYFHRRERSTTCSAIFCHDRSVVMLNK